MIEAHLLQILSAAQPSGADYQIRLLLVDDGSTDDTAATLALFCASHSDASYLRFTRNFGKEAAIEAGLAHAEGDAVVIMDSDLQHPPHLIADMVALWQGGAWVVEARKTYRGKERYASKLFAAAFYRTFHRLAGLDLHGQSDFKLLDRQVVLQFRQIKEKQRFFRGLVQWMHYPSACIPFEVPERAGGQSGWGCSSWRTTRYTTSPLFPPCHCILSRGLAC